MAPPSRDLLQQGHYARKQLFSRNAAVAWSHRRRFALAHELASAQAGGALLDYGCGDGTFIALAHESFRESVGADIDVGQVQGCTDRLGSLPRVRFLPIRGTASATTRSSAWKCSNTARQKCSPVCSKISIDLLGQGVA